MSTHLDLQRDLQTLESIRSSIKDLVKQAQKLTTSLDVREKGFFMPDEDNTVKRLFFTFRNHRIALFEIINRYEEYDDILQSDKSTRTFLLGLGSALLLYNWSSFLVHTYKDIEPIRKKLNEEDLSFGIEAGLFDTIYRNLTRVETQERLHMAVKDYEGIRDNIIRKIDASDPFYKLVNYIDELSSFVERESWDIWSNRIIRDIDVLPKRMKRPLKYVSFKLKNWICDLTGNIWLDHIPSIPNAHQQRFEDTLQPGDFLIVRPEQKTSTLLIPGWWTHAAVYFGGYEKLTQTNAHKLPNLKKHIHAINTETENEYPVVLEALSSGVVMNPLNRSLWVDHVVAFRPHLTQDELHEALNDLFSHYGKGYDFEFDLSSSERLVCTELLYRTLHGKGKINFSPNKRYGRLTITADDIIQQILKHIIAGNSKIEVLGISTKDLENDESTFLEGQEAIDMLIATQST